MFYRISYVSPVTRSRTACCFILLSRLPTPNNFSNVEKFADKGTSAFACIWKYSLIYADRVGDKFLRVINFWLANRGDVKYIHVHAHAHNARRMPSRQASGNAFARQCARCIGAAHRAPVRALKITVTNENRHFLISPTLARAMISFYVFTSREGNVKAARHITLNFADYAMQRFRDRLIPVAPDVIRNCV